MRNQKGFTVILAIVSVVIILSLSVGIYLLTKQTVRPENTTYQNPKTTPISTPINNVKPSVFIVKGRSMSPNYLKGQIWLYEKYTKVQPKRFDVVIFNNPLSPDVVINKRIIGLPNERVKIRSGKVYINDQVLVEDYTLENTFTSPGRFSKEGNELTVPNNSYFLLGDDRPLSSDSRMWGMLEQEKVIGKLMLQIEPLQMPDPPEKCICLDGDNNLCLPQIACQ